jgi:hypothetical protein
MMSFFSCNKSSSSMMITGIYLQKKYKQLCCKKFLQWNGKDETNWKGFMWSWFEMFFWVIESVLGGLRLGCFLLTSLVTAVWENFKSYYSTLLVRDVIAWRALDTERYLAPYGYCVWLGYLYCFFLFKAWFLDIFSMSLTIRTQNCLLSMK